MRQATVFINDHVGNRRVGLACIESDFARVDRQWDVEQQQLLVLQDIDVFRGRTRYSDLRTEHFRALIQQCLGHYAGLTDEQRQDAAHPTTKLMHFLLMGLIHRIEIDTGCHVELLRVNRITDRNITFEMSITMDMNFIKPPVVEDDAEFKVIVDNTK